MFPTCAVHHVRIGIRLDVDVDNTVLCTRCRINEDDVPWTDVAMEIPEVEKIAIACKR